MSELHRNSRRPRGTGWVLAVAAAVVGAFGVGLVLRSLNGPEKNAESRRRPARATVSPRSTSPSSSAAGGPTRPEEARSNPPSPGISPSPAVPPLFRDAGIDPIPEERVVRSHRVKLDPQAPGDEVRLALSDGVTITARKNRLERHSSTRWVWVGEVVGAPGSLVVLACRNDVVIGNVRVGERLWQIRPSGASGGHAVREVDLRSAGDECGGSVAMTPPPKRPGSGARHMDGSFDDGSSIDVMVVYTAAALASAGSVGAMLATIDAGIAESNTALQNSGVATRFRLVNAQSITYAESGAGSTDLDRLQDPADGFMDEVHGWRNTNGADLVVLIVGPCDVAGMGFLLISLQSWTEAYGFSLVREVFASGFYSITHELGHNLGCEHNRANAGSTPMYPYAYGYIAPADAFRTVMSYGGAPRVGHFSNPGVNYGGQPTGVADSEDNARCIGNNAYTVSNFRQTVVNGPPVLAGVGNQATAEGTNLAFALAAVDPDGDAITYSAVGLPAGAALNAATGAFSWTPGYTQNGVYNVTFRASDPFGGVDSEAITITVTDVNAAPTANAGPDATVDVSSTVTLNGTLSSDPDNDPLTFAWTQVSGPAVSLSSPAAAQPTFVPTVAGAYGFELVVNDGSLFSAPNAVAITANVNVATLPVPAPLTPPDGSTLAATPVDFTCTDLGAVGVTDYEFHILHNPAGTWTTYTAVVTTGPAATIGLPLDRAYRWMTRGRTSGTWGNYSGTFSLDLTSGPLQPPSSAPANVAASADARGLGTFSWDPLVGATSYVVTVQKSAMVKKKKSFFSRLIASLTGGKTYTLRKVWNTVFQIEQSDVNLQRALTGPGEYRVQVQGRNNFGPGPPSPWVVFSY